MKEGSFFENILSRIFRLCAYYSVSGIVRRKKCDNKNEKLEQVQRRKRDNRSRNMDKVEMKAKRRIKEKETR